MENSRKNFVEEKYIIRAIILGITSALNNYLAWSGGYALDEAPESFIRDEIARNLFVIFPFVTLEESIKAIISLSLKGKETKDLLDGFGKQKVDIVCWSKGIKPNSEDSEPLYLIEIKRSWGHIDIVKDVERIRGLLRDCPNIRGGFAAVYSDSTSRKTIKERFAGLAKESGTKFAEPPEILRRINYAGKESWWGPCVFKVDRP